MATKNAAATPTKRYPALYRCQHCTTEMSKREAGARFPTCPTCKFGSLKKMHWNGFTWH